MPQWTAHIRLATADDILGWSSGCVTTHHTFNVRSRQPKPGGLFDEAIFGRPREWSCACGRIAGKQHRDEACLHCRAPVEIRAGQRTRMGHIELATPVVHPWAFRHAPNHLARLLGLSPRDTRQLVDGLLYLVQRPGASGLPVGTLVDVPTAFTHLADDSAFAADTGGTAVARVLRQLDLDRLVAVLRADLAGTLSKSSRAEVTQRLAAVEWFRKSANRPESLVLTHIPVLPMGLRPAVAVSRRDTDITSNGIRQRVSQAFSTSDLNELYRRVLQANGRLAAMIANGAPEGMQSRERRQLQRAVDALHDNGTGRKPATDPHGRPFHSLADRLGGKNGRFRGNLLGKRVDYSGRAVIVVGPELALHQCGLPRRMVVELFEPFLVSALIRRGLARDVADALRNALPELVRDDYVARSVKVLLDDLIDTHAANQGEKPNRWRGDETAFKRASERLRELGNPAHVVVAHKLLDDGGDVESWLVELLERRQDEFWQLVAETVRHHPVLLNRAPTLHRLGIQAFEPLMIDGNAIRLHPVVCKAFAADFDGDQMAVHVPLSFEAQVEARVLLMAPNNLFGPSSGRPIAVPTQDVVLGCGFLTAAPRDANSSVHPFIDANEVRRAVETGQLKWHDRVSVGRSPSRRTTTAGRILFHDALPAELPFRDEAMTSVSLSHRIAEAHEQGGPSLAMRTIDAIQRVGFWAATRSGTTFSLTDLPPVPIDWTPFDQLRESLARGVVSMEDYNNRLIRQWFDMRPAIEGDLRAGLLAWTNDGPNPLGVMVESKARGSVDQMRQLGAARGPISRMSNRGTAQLVRHSYRQGLTPFEYFASASGGRKSLAEKGLGTSDAGDLTRRLVYAAQRVIVTEDDCGTAHGRRMALAQAAGRVALTDIVANNVTHVRAGKVIWPATARDLEWFSVQEVMVRTPLTCQSAGGKVCRRCYGVDHATGKLVEVGMAVGVIAAQSIGEPGTQFTMRTFHAGGVASDKDIVRDLRHVRAMFEGHSDAACKALETDGPIRAQQVLVEEFQAIYREQQLDIDDRHFEVIVRQMFRLVEVIEPGQTSFAPGQLVEKDTFHAENAKVERKADCRPTLRGLRRIIRESEGFLASAAFQDTVNVLFEAALGGRRDDFAGLKEHILIGERIPAGTGRTQREAETDRNSAVG